MSVATRSPGTTRSTTSVVAHVFNEDLLSLFPNHTVDYKRVAQIADLSKADIGKIGKVAKASVRFDDKIPQPVAQRLSEIGNIANLVAEYFAGDVHKVELWFRLPNPMLGNVSPRDLIRMGRYERLLNFVLDARDAEQGAVVADAAGGGHR